MGLPHRSPTHSAHGSPSPMSHINKTLLLALLVHIPGLVMAADGLEWPQFRGPAGQGHAAAHELPTAWSEDDNVVWKCPLPGRGWSSPVISGNEIWLTTAVDSPVTELEK